MPLRVLLAIVLVAGTARAQSSQPLEDKLRDVIDEVGDRHWALGALASLAYTAVYDPEFLRQLPYQLYGELLSLIDKDPVLKAVVLNTRDLYRGGYLRLDLDAGATTDLSVPGAAMASLDAAWEIPLCRLAAVAASGLVGYDEGSALASYSAMVGGCIPLPANTIEAAYTRRDNVRTSVLARPVTLLERRTSDIIEIDLRFYRWRGPVNQIDIGPITIDIDHSYDHDGATLGAWTSSVGVAPVEWRRRQKGLAGTDQVFRFMYVHFWDLSDDNSSRFAQAGHLAPVAVDGIRLTDDMTFGADVGVQFAGSYDGPSMTPVTLLQKRGMYADLNIAQVVGPVATMVRASHTMLPLFDGQLVRDNRLAGSIQLTLPGSTLRAEGFLAREQVLRDMPGGTTFLVGGGAADAAWSAGRGLVVFGRLEAARSLVAGLASEPVRTINEVRATLGINAHYDVRWPTRR